MCSCHHGYHSVVYTMRSHVVGPGDHVLSILQTRSLQPFRRYPARQLKVQRVLYKRSNPVHIPQGGSALDTQSTGHLKLQSGITL